MIPSPEPHCWTHPSVAARSSSIAGTGLFALAPIPAGEVVARLGGRLVSGDALRALLATAERQPDHPYVDSITVDEDLHLVLPDERTEERTIGYANHSCDPNLWWVGAYTLVARWDLAPGAELTSDYATSTDDPAFVLDCRCGAPDGRCRSTVRGTDWRLPELRRRYGDHWVPALLARMRGSGGS